MLDAISDFWKPSKKPSLAEHRADLAALKIGSSVGFGFMPQVLLSGKRREVSAVNTYMFGDERLTSCVLADGDDKTISLIVADVEGQEPYLAISRRLQFAERMRMIDNAELLALIENADQKRLQVKDVDGEWRQWLVPQYKKEIHGLKGRFAKGDFRTFTQLPEDAEVLDFTYFLLTSTNNEFAVEVEMYADNRIELYATVYRRITDIGEVREPRASDEPMLPGMLTTNLNTSPVASSPSPTLVVTSSAPLLETPEEEPIEPLFSAPVAANDLQHIHTAPADVVVETPIAASEAVQHPLHTTPITLDELDVNKLVEPEALPPQETQPTKETLPMTVATFTPPATSFSKPVHSLSQAKDYENDTIECELRAANKIIEEAIRNEMRMSDVIRRVIGLPLAGQESVQIPVLLSDDDYKLLAIRYGMNVSDKSSIKARIIEEVNDFSGKRA